MLRATIAIFAGALAAAASAVKGNGTITFGASVEHVSVSASGSSGRAEFHDKTVSGNVNGTIEINCVRIAGNEATVSGIVTHSSRKSLEGFEVDRQQVLEQPGVPFVVYRGTSGCRVIVLFHKLA